MKLLICFVFCVYSFSSFASDLYSMEDLNKLAESKSWAELTEHLTDITPSKRDQNWSELVNTALTSRFRELDTLGNTKLIIEFLEKTFPRYPAVRNNEVFMKLRGEFGIRYYESCFSYNDNACHKELLGFVKTDPNPLYALKVAKLVRLRMSNIKAIEYFGLALSQKLSTPTTCDDEDLRLSLEDALQTDPDSDYAKAAKMVAFGQCFEFFKKNIITTVNKSDNAKSNACEELIARNALTGIAKKKCERHLKK